MCSLTKKALIFKIIKAEYGKQEKQENMIKLRNILLL